MLSVPILSPHVQKSLLTASQCALHSGLLTKLIQLATEFDRVESGWLTDISNSRSILCDSTQRRLIRPAIPLTVMQQLSQLCSIKRHSFWLQNLHDCANLLSSQSASADHVLGYAHLPPHRWTTLYHGCAQSLASGRSHMRVLPPGMLCPTTSAPWLILSSSENYWNHTILVKLLTFVDFCFFLGVLAFGWLL